MPRIIGCQHRLNEYLLGEESGNPGYNGFGELLKYLPDLLRAFVEAVFSPFPYNAHGTFQGVAQYIFLSILTYSQIHYFHEFIQNPFMILPHEIEIIACQKNMIIILVFPQIL